AMIDPLVILTILMMALVTYLTRIDGYLLLRDRTVSPRMAAVMETAPGCVLITVIAPHFVTGRPADMIALALTILAATRLPLLPVVLLAISSAGILRLIM
ncbi:AzlD family protein, partial [Paracoccus sp. 22332]|uniref:AzlD family protein n=1 Tax=Paracoccus sp. 22332 TaxID=3453913 RepID=UPI003F850E97